jgi:ubiquinone/menaquinone biosynthesis C-methylase UbiE
MLHRLRFTLSYLGRPPWDSGVSPPELFDFIATHPAGRAIDLGCGSGTNVLSLARNGWQVTGIDFAATAIWIARRKIQRGEAIATLSVGDVTHLEAITGSFDLALDLGCFHGIGDRQAYLIQLRRLLGTGGHWLMYGFFRTAAEHAGPGLDDATLRLIETHGFRLVSRTDGVDKRSRPSAWFLYQEVSQDTRPRPPSSAP